jgi:hypothetical protein
VATASLANRIPADVCPRPTLPRSALLSALLLIPLFLSPLSISAQPQVIQSQDAQSDAPTSVRGTVLNRLTHEPISRALVFSPDNRYATLTDDRGRFEFKFPPLIPPSKDQQSAAPDASVFRARQLRMIQNARPNFFYARKPGFLQNNSNPNYGPVTANQPETVIYLDPESLVVGNVNLPGSEGDMRILVVLYRREITEGREHWQQVKTFNTWADGDFRFSELQAGTYKVGTNELLDRNFAFYPTGGPLFGFPPIFYPGVSDFASAAPIQLAAGASVQVNLAPIRREYYPVKIPVANAGDAPSMSVNIYPLARPGPGFSLGYNSGEQMIQGSLPDGNYTVQVSTQGPSGSTGLLNISVQGGPRQAPPINLIPNTSLAVTVHEEFKSGQSVFGEEPAASDDGTPARQRQVNVQVVLQSIEEFGSAPTVVSEPAPGTQENALLIQNIQPGRYRVHVQSGIGYAASVVYGESNLLRQPLVVALGGSSQPMEITLRDDGVSVDGKIEEAVEGHIYFLPLDEGSGEFREFHTGPDGSFGIAQLPPGAYRVLAFDTRQSDLACNDADTMRKLESKGQVIHLEAGQNEHLRLKLIQEGNAQ